jgi:hypothetical protein
MPKLTSCHWGILAALAVAIVSHASSSGAAPMTITEAEKKFCKQDYKHFCGSYGLESPALTACMRKAGPKLSRGCVDALVKSGKVSRAEVSRRKKAR